MSQPYAGPGTGGWPRVFLSYRREDTRHLAGRLADHLRPRFELFMDVETIRPGTDFTQAVRQAVRQSDVVLALIGADWLQARDELGRRRLDDPHDWVVTEIGTALTSGLTVIPVLVDDARMPDPAQLPPPLAGLASRQAVRLRHESFNDDVNRLAGYVDQAVWARRPVPAPQPPAHPARPAAPRRSPVRPLLVVLLVAAVLAGGLLAWTLLRPDGTPSTDQTSASSASPTATRSAGGTRTTRPPTSAPPSPPPSPQLQLPLGTTAEFPYFDITAYSVTQDPAQGYLVQAKVCLNRLTGSGADTSTISWRPWSVTADDGHVYGAGLRDPSTEPPQMFAETGRYGLHECAEGVIPFGDVADGTTITGIGYSNQFVERASWTPS